MKLLMPLLLLLMQEVGASAIADSGSTTPYRGTHSGTANYRYHYRRDEVMLLSSPWLSTTGSDGMEN